MYPLPLFFCFGGLGRPGRPPVCKNKPSPGVLFLSESTIRTRKPFRHRECRRRTPNAIPASSRHAWRPTTRPVLAVYTKASIVHPTTQQEPRHDENNLSSPSFRRATTNVVCLVGPALLTRRRRTSRRKCRGRHASCRTRVGVDGSSSVSFDTRETASPNESKAVRVLLAREKETASSKRCRRPWGEQPPKISRYASAESSLPLAP